jgi:acetyl/propionyl-CoA carboxylase alpha subunit
MALNVQVGDDLNYSISIEGEKVLVNGLPADWNIAPTGENNYHVLMGTRSFDICVSGICQEKKIYTIRVNNNSYTVKVGDELDILLQKMGMGRSGLSKMGDVKAPMPGLVLNILVQEGDVVEKGASLLVLEAMKMENVIKASGTGTVRSIKVKKRDTVDKNQLLIEMA